MGSDTGDFHTQKGYQMQQEGRLTLAMEDYLEMICRQTVDQDFLRVNVLAHHLHVTPSSASKMLNNLKGRGLVEFEKYGVVRPTEDGRQLGEYLLHRHRVLYDFFCLLNGTNDELPQVEQTEHFITKETLQNLERLLPWLKLLRSAGV